MEEALSFFRAFEVWIYLLLGLGGLIYIRKFILAWQELRGAAFGLERENAQTRLNQSASVLVLILTMTVTEFVLVSFIAPAVPGATPLPTPTLNLLATPTYTLPAVTLPAGQEGTVAPPPVVQANGSGCVPGQIEILSPKEGDEVSGAVEVKGTASIPNFGFFKYEMNHPGDAVWQTIQAGDTPRVNEVLGTWDTRLLAPGEYQLGLVVIDNQAKSSPVCSVKVRVTKAAAETPVP